MLLVCWNPNFITSIKCQYVCSKIFFAKQILVSNVTSPGGGHDPIHTASTEVRRREAFAHLGQFFWGFHQTWRSYSHERSEVLNLRHVAIFLVPKKAQRSILHNIAKAIRWPGPTSTPRSPVHRPAGEVHWQVIKIRM